MARPRQVSDEEILCHARAAFIEGGAGVSTTEVAKRAGLSQAALFKRFGTKDRLLTLALAPDPSELIAWLQSGPDPRPFLAQLHDLGSHAASFMDENAPALNVLMSCHLRPAQVFAHFDVPPPMRVHIELVAWFERAIAAGQLRRVDTGKLALAIMGAMRTQVMLRSLLEKQGVVGSQPYESQAFAHDVLTMLFEGLKPEGAP